jgi:hypothetical protein
MYVMTLWRLNVKTDAKPDFDPFQYCMAKSIAGIGWRVEDEVGSPPQNLEQYRELGHVQYSEKGDKSWWPAFNVFGYRMAQGDLCWTRDSGGTYYLGRIGGPWMYLHGKEADNFDIHSVRPCHWQKVGLLDSVPRAVERSFAPARTVQAINDPTTAEFSEYLYSKLAGEPSPPPPNARDLFALLSPLDHEDLAGLYLQADQNYVVVPSTVKPSGVGYEWVMFHRLTGEKAVLQVKSGHAAVDLMALGKLDCLVFIVVADAHIDQGAPKNVRFIQRGTLLDFAMSTRSILPERIRRYLDWAGL